MRNLLLLLAFAVATPAAAQPPTDTVLPAGEAYTIYVAYTAKPDELHAKGSAAIRDAKGLYFINPDSAEAGKPVQIWTQGETEANLAWFPTIDKHAAATP